MRRVGCLKNRCGFSSFDVYQAFCQKGTDNPYLFKADKDQWAAQENAFHFWFVFFANTSRVTIPGNKMTLPDENALIQYFCVYVFRYFYGVGQRAIYPSDHLVKVDVETKGTTLWEEKVKTAWFSSVYRKKSIFSKESDTKVSIISSYSNGINFNTNWFSAFFCFAFKKTLRVNSCRSSHCWWLAHN